ncbi:MAG: four helix bundle protein [Saprospiraceae bacterium]
MSYKKLEIWRLADSLVVKVHKMSLKELPKFEMYEVGSQVRRSVKSIKSNIVEGYGRRYKNDFIKFLVYPQASLDETVDHIETLYRTESLKNKALFDDLATGLDVLGKKLNKFLQAVERNYQSPR